MVQQIEKIFLSAEYRIEGTGYENENTDVIVLLEDGQKYTASFFTYDNIKEQQIKNRKSGKYLNGKYFWEKGMILIEKCSSEQIMDVVKDLILEGDFETAFQKI